MSYSRSSSYSISLPDADQQNQMSQDSGQQQYYQNLGQQQLSSSVSMQRALLNPYPAQGQQQQQQFQPYANQAQAAAAWNYYQQNMMRYSAQQQSPPAYPPPVNGYPNFQSPDYIQHQMRSTSPSGFNYNRYPYPQSSEPGYSNPMPRPVQNYQQNPQAHSPSSGKDGKKQDEKNQTKEMKVPPIQQPEIKEVKKQPIVVGKRRGGRVLPTGVVKKPKTENEDEGRKDPWSQYMNEVKKYKEQSCSEDQKNRPLVK